MKRAFQVSHAAAKDIDGILAYVLEKGGRRAAARLTETLYKKLQLVASRPEVGHTRQDLTGAKVLFWRVRSYLVVYRTDVSPIEIVRVLHGARDLRALLRGL